MTKLQRLLITLLPRAWASAIEAESRAWLLRCSECGTARSVWERGGMRFKAASTRRKMMLWCEHCERMHLMELVRMPSE
jgi:hypothetical protein